jgi:hypothetical protein
MNAAQSWRVALFVSSIAAIVIVTPLIFFGNATGHDFQSHVASWMEIAAQWRQGIIFPRWAEWSNWGLGEPRFIFYPPGSWVFGAALGSVLPWSVVPGALIFLAVITAGMAMWTLARLWLTEVQAYAAAVIFAANPYHLVMIYYRSDFAELLASALFPLMVFGAFAAPRTERRRLPILIMIVAGIWLLNAPAGVIATYSLAVILLFVCIFHRSLRPLIFGATGLAGGLAVAAFYVLPAAWEQRWIQIAGAFQGRFIAERNLLFSQIDYPTRPEIQWFNWKVSGVAVGVIVLTAIASFCSRRYARLWPERWWLMFLLAGVSSFLMIPPSSFLWRHLPRLRAVQFPWRWLMPLDFVLAFLAAAAISKIKASWIFIIMLGLIVTAAAIVRDTHWDSRIVPFVAQQIQSEHGYRGIPGFLPINAHVGEQYDNRPQIAAWEPGDNSVESPELKIEKWTAEQKVFLANAAKPVTLVLHLLAYPAWEVQIDGESRSIDFDPATGQILVPLEKGSHRIEVRFRRTWDRLAGGVISIISIVGLIFILVYDRRKRVI